MPFASHHFLESRAHCNNHSTWYPRVGGSTTDTPPSTSIHFLPPSARTGSCSPHAFTNASLRLATECTMSWTRTVSSESESGVVSRYMEGRTCCQCKGRGRIVLLVENRLNQAASGDRTGWIVRHVGKGESPKALVKVGEMGRRVRCCTWTWANSQLKSSLAHFGNLGGRAHPRTSRSVEHVCECMFPPTQLLH